MSYSAYIIAKNVYANAVKDETMAIQNFEYFKKILISHIEIAKIEVQRMKCTEGAVLSMNKTVPKHVILAYEDKLRENADRAVRMAEVSKARFLSSNERRIKASMEVERCKKIVESFQFGKK